MGGGAVYFRRRRSRRYARALGPALEPTDIAYDTDGFVASVKDEGGTFRYFTYDLYGRLRQVKNHSGTVVQAHGYTYSRTGPNWTFDPASPNAVVDTAFIQQTPTVKAVVSTGYLDGLGRPIQTVVQDGANYHVSATQYDLMGRTWRVWKAYTRTTAGFDPNATSPTAGAARRRSACSTGGRGRSRAWRPRRARTRNRRPARGTTPAASATSPWPP